MGTNPLSVAAPGKDGDSFVLDMATSAVALGKVSDKINVCLLLVFKTTSVIKR